MKKILGIVIYIITVSSVVFAENFELKQLDGTTLEIVGDKSKTYSVQLIETSSNETRKINVVLEKYDNEYNGLNNQLKEKLEEYNTIKQEYEKDLSNEFEYNQVVEEYNGIVEKINGLENKKDVELKAYIPLYKNDEWNEIKDKQFQVDEDLIKNQNIIIVWLKDENKNVEYKIYNSIYGEQKELNNVITLDANKVQMNKGKKCTIKATINEEIYILDELEWKTSDESIATVSEGVIKAKKEGKCTITVSTSDGKYMETCELEVMQSSMFSKITFNVFIAIIIISVIIILDKVYLKNK